MARGEAERDAGLRERPGYEYGPGLEDPHYGLYSPDVGPYYNYLGPEYGAPDSSSPQREPSSEFGGSTFLRTPQLHPVQSQPRYLPSQMGEYCRRPGGVPAVSSRFRLCPESTSALLLKPA